MIAGIQLYKLYISNEFLTIWCTSNSQSDTLVYIQASLINWNLLLWSTSLTNIF